MVGWCDYADVAKELKERKVEIVDRLEMLDSMIASKFYDTAWELFPKIKQFVKYKDDFEVKIEAVERLILKMAIKELGKFATRSIVLENMSVEFRQRHYKRLHISV